MTVDESERPQHGLWASWLGRCLSRRFATGVSPGMRILLWIVFHRHLVGWPTKGAPNDDVQSGMATEFVLLVACSVALFHDINNSKGSVVGKGIAKHVDLGNPAPLICIMRQPAVGIDASRFDRHFV